MINTEAFVSHLQNLGAGLYTGVPDSLLSTLSAYLLNKPEIPHIIAANEGNAVGYAIGDYMATGKPTVVYMQNSGLGNTVNPITSLADPLIYGIPMMLVIGWRGKPGEKDEPQHLKQGAVTLTQLDTLSVPYLVVERDAAEDEVLAKISALWQKMLDRQGPVALVIESKTFAGKYPLPKSAIDSDLTREDAIDTVISTLPEDAFYVATTGKTGRELFELREAKHQPQRDFLTVGGMGHASSIAMAIAKHRTKHLTVCLDGDGASLMHLGAMALIANQAPAKMIHVVLNNSAHDSVGGQPTIAASVDFKLLSEALHYTGYFQADTKDALTEALKQAQKMTGPVLIEVRVRVGARADLGRPTRTPLQNKLAVMEFLKDD
jgi:phosphonopyruvate decarboxylase